MAPPSKTRKGDMSADNPRQPSPDRVERNFVKPKYPGKFVGQSVSTNDRMQSKPVSWEAQPTGDRRFGRVSSMGKVVVVWDGSDWVSQQEWDTRRGKHTR